MSLLLTAVWTCYFGFLSALAPNYTWILLLRGLCGFGIGGAPQSVTIFSEFLPAATRARSIMAVEVYWAVGTVCEVILALIVMPIWGFRALLFVSAIPLLLFVAAAKYMPESPRYHVSIGRPDLAQKTLEDIARKNGKILPSGGLKVPENTTGNQGRGQISDLFKDAETKKTTVYLWLIWFQCAFAYYGLVLLSTSLFQEQAAHDSGVADTCPAEKVSMVNIQFLILYLCFGTFMGYLFSICVSFST